VAGTQLPTNLAAIGALGVDTIDLGGAAVVDASIDAASAAAMIAAGLQFASADNITLSVAGTQLPTNLAAIGALGVDTIDLGGAAVVDATIDAASAAAMIAAGLQFASADNITLSVAGTQLPTNLAAIGALGVDTIDLGSAAVVDATIDQATADAMIAAGLEFASSDSITLLVAGTELPTSMTTLHDLHVDQIVYTGTGTMPDIADDNSNRLLSTVAVAEFDNFRSVAVDASEWVEAVVEAVSVELPSTDVILPVDADDAFGDLIRLLSANSVEDLSLPTGNEVTVDDSLAAVLAEAGMLEILPATQLQLDATGSGQVVDTSLATMARLGVDQVQLGDQGDAPVYVDLGLQSGTATGAELLALFNALDVDDDRATPLFVGATNVALVIDQGTAELIRDTAGASTRSGALASPKLPCSTPLTASTRRSAPLRSRSS